MMVAQVLGAVARFEASSSESIGASYDIAAESVAALSPSVATSLSVVETPAGVLLEIDVPDAQSVLSHSVKPIRALPL